MSLQRAITSSEAEEPEQTRMSYPIGINLGDVMHEGGDFHGDGVNVAARLKQMNDPGGLFISGTAYDQLRTPLMSATKIWAMYTSRTLQTRSMLDGCC